MKPAIFIVFVFLFIFHIRAASAHVLFTDGSIGAVIHVDPDDDPYVGKEAKIHLDFKDRAAKFDFAKCACKAVILENGKEVFREDLQEPTFAYVFPKKGIYHLEIEGSPRQVGSFQPFTLTYDIRVAREAGETAPSRAHNHNSIILYGMAGIVTFFIYVYEGSQNKIIP